MDEQKPNVPEKMRRFGTNSPYFTTPARIIAKKAKNNT
jgi:hypothetical protein